MTCENVTIQGDKGTPITAYVARPSGHGPFPGVVLVHHLPGWSEFYIEGWRQRRQPRRRRRQGARRGRHCRLPDGRRYRGRSEVDARPARSQRQGWSNRFLLGRPARLHLCLSTKGRRCLRRTMGGTRGDGQGGAQSQDARRADRHDKGPLRPAARPVRQRRPRAESRAGEPARGRAQEARQDVRFPPLRWRRPWLLLLAPAALSARAGDGWVEQDIRLFRQASGEVGGRTCARPSSRSYARRAWRNAETHGSRYRGRWLPMTTRAMRHWATSSRSTSSIRTSTPVRGRGSSYRWRRPRSCAPLSTGRLLPLSSRRRKCAARASCSASFQPRDELVARSFSAGAARLASALGRQDLFTLESEVAVGLSDTPPRLWPPRARSGHRTTWRMGEIDPDWLAFHRRASARGAAASGNVRVKRAEAAPPLAPLT